MSDTSTYDDESETNYGRNRGERGKWVSALIALLGLWLIVQAIALDIVPGNFWNDVIIGTALLLIGAYNYYRRADNRLGSAGAAALAALLGLWLLVSPWVYGDAGAAAQTNDLGFWNDVIVGLLVLLLGAYSAYEARSVDMGRPVER